VKIREVLNELAGKDPEWDVVFDVPGGGDWSNEELDINFVTPDITHRVVRLSYS